MSRLPPKIEQVIDGVPVSGWQVNPISRDGITYALSKEVRTNDEHTGSTGEDHFVEAKRDDGEVLWKTKFASYDFEPGLETDVQGKYPVDLYFHENGQELVVKLEHYTENDRVFRIMLSDGKKCS